MKPATSGSLVRVFLALAMLVVACGDGSGVDTTVRAPSTASTVPPPVPTTDEAPLGRSDLPSASVTVTAASEATTSGVIGVAGGVLSTTHDGVTYTLSIPEGALLSDVEIEITPIAGLHGPAVQDAASTGLLLEPDGLWLVEPAMLEVEGMSLDETVGFAATGDGDDFHLVPASEAGLELSSFSVHGFVDAVVTEFAESYQPQSTATSAEHQIALAIQHDRTALAVEVMRQWAAEIATAVSDFPNRGIGFHDQFTAEALHWLRIRKQVQEGLDLSDEEEELLFALSQHIFSLWSEWYRAEVERLIEECRSLERPESALLVFRWSMVVQFGFSQVTGLSFQFDEVPGWDALRRCIGGTIQYRAELVGESIDEIDGSIHYEASARIPVQFGEDPGRRFYVVEDGSGVFASLWLAGSWTLDEFDVTGDDLQCLEREDREGVARARVVWANVQLNLGRYHDEDLEPPVLMIEIVEPFSVKCHGLELAHLAHNQLTLANSERVPEAPAGLFAFVTEYDSFTTNFVTASSEQERGDLFGAQWEIDQRVDWAWNGGD